MSPATVCSLQLCIYHCSTRGYLVTICRCRLTSTKAHMVQSCACDAWLEANNCSDCCPTTDAESGVTRMQFRLPLILLNWANKSRCDCLKRLKLNWDGQKFANAKRDFSDLFGKLQSGISTHGAIQVICGCVRIAIVYKTCSDGILGMTN